MEPTVDQLAWYIGTMGFGYSDWTDVFYPEGLKKRDYLGYYSNFFNAVEMDSTFYGTPRADVVARWAQIVPEEFIICPKMPRAITHDARLVDVAAGTEQFLDTMRLLGPTLGPILIQFPPDFTRAAEERLADFLATLPDDLRYAVEFRDRSWHATATGELLQAHEVCWVSSDYIYMPERVYVTTDFLYIRFLGRHGTYQVKDHERVDRTPRLREWLEDIRARQDEGIHTVYGFFNDDYAGHAPATAQKFKRVIGLPTQSLQPPRQQRLL